MRQLDVLFVHPGAANVIYQELSNKFSGIEPPTWSLLLAQAARAKGFGAGILDCDAERLADEDALKRILELKPRLVCFAVYGQNPNAGTTKMTGVVSLAALLRDNSDVPVAVVGSHASALPLETLSHKGVDFVMTNEGVYALLDLLRSDLRTDLQNIAGLGWNGYGRANLNGPAKIVPQALMDVDLPGSAWDLLPYREKPFDLYRSCNWHANFIEERRSPYAAIYTSLGCRFKCSFCLAKGTTVICSKGRNRKIEKIVVGDKLCAFDTSKMAVVETEVVAVSSRTVDTLYRITFSDGRVIRCTAEHPIYIDGKWVEASRVKTGDRGLLIDQSDKLTLNRMLYPRKSPFADPSLKQRNSERMKLNNPMKNPAIAGKVSQTHKIAYAEGKTTPFLCTPEGRAIASKCATERMTANNPMWKEENCRKHSERMRGDQNPAWRGGTSDVGYPPEFNSKLKRIIRKRDGRKCMECGETKCRLDVHHIDYDKSNCSPCNLITLCMSCHMKSNFDRDSHTAKYREVVLQYGNCPHWSEVTSVVIESGEFEVFNFRCEPHNNYFAEYVLTHNCMINIVNRTSHDAGVSAANFNTMRFWSPELMFKEFESLHKMGVRTIRISDEMFFLDKRYFEPLLQMLVDSGIGKDLMLWSYARVDTVRPKYLELFKNAGMNYLALGIEAADTTIRKEVTKGSYEEVDVRDVVREVELSGINVIANYIFGLPEDNYETMGKTLDLALELNTAMANMYPCFALPGSPLHNEAVARGWDLPRTYDAWSFHSYECLPLPTKHLSAGEVLRFRDKAWQMYFSREEYQSMVEKKFGAGAATHVRDMVKVKLKRRLLGD